MPLYDFACTSCSRESPDVYLSLREHEAYTDGSAPVLCECGGSMRTIISSVPTVGPTMTRPLTSRQLERDFTSPAEYRRYLRANPHIREHSGSSQTLRRHKDQARERAEVMAQKQGYRDWEHRQDELRTEKGRRRLRQNTTDHADRPVPDV